MPVCQLETLLTEIAAFPDGKHDDQVDALSYVAAYSGKVIHEARRWGLKLGRLRLPPPQVQIVPPKSRDQELHEQRPAEHHPAQAQARGDGARSAKPLAEMVTKAAEIMAATPGR